MNYKNIGLKIRYFRTANGITQEKLAEKTNLSRVLISYIERGERIASLETMVKISNALEVNISDILSDDLKVTNSIYDSEIFNLLLDCSKEESQILRSSLISLKAILNEYYISK